MTLASACQISRQGHSRSILEPTALWNVLNDAIVGRFKITLEYQYSSSLVYILPLVLAATCVSNTQNALMCECMNTN